MKNIFDEFNCSSKTTLKEKIIILSRLDCMAKPTLPRLITFCELMLLAIVLINCFSVSELNINNFNPKIPDNGFHLLSARSSSLDANQYGDETQLTFVGDINLGRYVQQVGEMQGYDQFFSKSAEVWENSDLVFGNLECVVLDDEDKYTQADKNVILSATEQGLRAAKESGINVLSVANNHAADYGGKGIECELGILKQLGINFAGAGENDADASKGICLSCRGLKIGFLALTDFGTEGLYSTDFTLASSANNNIYSNAYILSSRTDLVVAYLHCGTENAIKFNDRQQKIARQLIESGVDIVIGSHPHVLQSVEKYKDGIIFYSLGNYIFDQGNRDNQNTVQVQLNINNKNGDAEFSIIPMHIDNFCPGITSKKLYLNEIQNTITKGLKGEDWYETSEGIIHIPMNFMFNKGSISI